MAKSSVMKRVEAFLLANIGNIVTGEEIREAAKDPDTGKYFENWHQRLSELRTDKGYTIESWRDRQDLALGQYIMPHAKKRPSAEKRVKPTPQTWQLILENANHACEWNEGGETCGLKDGEMDPIGGGTVKLTPDHKKPHSIHPNADRTDPSQWQALCGRHQVMKKNYWDTTSGKLNVHAILQCASEKEKKKALEFLSQYFNKK